MLGQLPVTTVFSLLAGEKRKQLGQRGPEISRLFSSKQCGRVDSSGGGDGMTVLHQPKLLEREAPPGTPGAGCHHPRGTSAQGPGESLSLGVDGARAGESKR